MMPPTFSAFEATLFAHGDQGVIEVLLRAIGKFANSRVRCQVRQVVFLQQLEQSVHVFLLGTGDIGEYIEIPFFADSILKCNA
jgi:hypothetical protein